MSTLSAFLAENTLPAEHVKLPVSARFLDENKKPVLWEVKTISAAEDEELRRECLKRVPVPGRKSQYQRETDYDKYLGKLAVACTVFPNLNSAELQDSYHVRSGEEVLKVMLTAGEYAEYITEVQKICGFDTPLQEDVDEAKN